MTCPSALLPGPSTRENIQKAVVPFMAGVLEHGVFAVRHWKLDSPGLRECGFVIYRELVHQLVVGCPCEPFGEMKILIRASEVRLIGEVGGIHDQSVSFPVTARIAQPEA